MKKGNYKQRLKRRVQQLHQQFLSGRLAGKEKEWILRVLRVIVEQGVAALPLNLERIGIAIKPVGRLTGDERGLKDFLAFLPPHIRNRVANCLRNTNIRTVPALVVRTEIAMLKIKNFGRKSFQGLTQTLTRFGLRLGMHEEEVGAYFSSKSVS